MKTAEQPAVHEVYFCKNLVAGLVQRREEDSDGAAKREIVKDLLEVWKEVLDNRSQAGLSRLATVPGAGLYVEPSGTIGRLVFPETMELAIAYRIVDSGGSVVKEVVLDAGIRIQNALGEDIAERCARKVLSRRGYLPGRDYSERLFATRRNPPVEIHPLLAGL